MRPVHFDYLKAGLLLTLILTKATSTFAAATGHYCLACTDVVQPRHCADFIRCETGQYCYVEKFIASNGDQRFNLGCRSQQACSTYMRTRALGHNFTVDMEDTPVSCTECCTSDLCNSFGCGELGYPLTTGPVCASCTAVRNPSLCNHLRVCESSQVCNVHQFVEFSDTLYTSQCMSQYECSRQLDPGSSIIGKRDDSNLSKQRVSRASSCNKCCQDNLCNLDCTDTSTHIPPSAKPNPSAVFVRLVGGHNAYEGRVEVYAFGEWGTICDDSWSSADAGVICSMLGYSRSGAVAVSQAAYGTGTGRIWLDDVNCQGSETTIASCTSNAWGTHNCGHGEDAGIVCSFNNFPDNFLLLTDAVQEGIYRMDMTTYSYVNIPLVDIINPVAIDYDPVEGTIFWTEVVLNTINSASINGSNQRIIRSLNRVAVPDGIAVDSLSRLLFYTDTGNDIIAALSFDGFIWKTIINNSLDEPRAIVADPINGVIYWTDWGSIPKIEKSNYDGTNRRVLINTDVVWPNGLAVDIQAGVMYWCDGSTGVGKIERANVDGSNRQVLESRLGGHFFGIDVYQSYLFFTDWSQRSVSRIGTDGIGLTSVGPATFVHLNDIHVHKNGYGQQGSNGCSNSRGGCSHFCFPQPGGSRMCVCPDGMTLQSDGTTCGGCGANIAVGSRVTRGPDWEWGYQTTTTTKKTTTSTAIAGCGANIVTGKRVTRGPTWQWNEQDGGAGNPGTVNGISSGYWWTVTWDMGGSNTYRMGEGFQDLCVL